MPYHLDYSDQVRFGLKEYEDDVPEPLYPWPVPEPVKCSECGAWGFDANDPHERHCSYWREPDTELPF